MSIAVHIRWMIRLDYPEVLEIEQQGSEYPWSEEGIIACLRQRNCIGMVAEYDDRVVGFVVYELHRDRSHVLNFAVRAEFRRRGVGHQMMQMLVSKLSHQRRVSITVHVRETNDPFLYFLRSQGFEAVRVIRNHFDNEDAYRLVYRYVPETGEVADDMESVAG